MQTGKRWKEENRNKIHFEKKRAKIHCKDDKRCKQVKEEKKKNGIKSISKKERAKIWGAPKANKRDTKARPPEGANSVMTEIPRKITPTFEKKEEHLFFRKRNTYYFWARKSKNTFSRQQPLHSPFVVPFRGKMGSFCLQVKPFSEGLEQQTILRKLKGFILSANYSKMCFWNNVIPTVW